MNIINIKNIIYYYFQLIIYMSLLDTLLKYNNKIIKTHTLLFTNNTHNTILYKLWNDYININTLLNINQLNKHYKTVLKTNYYKYSNDNILQHIKSQINNVNTLEKMFVNAPKLKNKITVYTSSSHIHASLNNMKINNIVVNKGYLFTSVLPELFINNNISDLLISISIPKNTHYLYVYNQETNNYNIIFPINSNLKFVKKSNVQTFTYGLILKYNYHMNLVSFNTMNAIDDITQLSIKYNRILNILSESNVPFLFQENFNNIETNAIKYMLKKEKCSTQHINNIIVKLGTKLQSMNRFPDLSNCSVAFVGNGPNILHNNYGKVIDKHDIIVRFNNYHISKYNKHVGERTHIVILNKFYFNKIDTFKTDWCILMDCCTTNKDILTSLLLNTKNNKLIICPSLIKNNNIGNKNGEYYSSGYRAIYYLKNLCKSVSLFGFGERNGHYFNPEHQMWDEHNLDKEFNEYKQWSNTNFVIYK
jgi:hypothetical protein